jgi:hypothetical protein
MTERDEHPFGGDEHGLVDLAELESVARRFTAREFAAAYPLPGLLIELAAGQEGEGGGAEGESRHLLTVSVPSVDFMAYVGRVGFLAKRPGNPFPRMISLGRTSSMDLVLDVRSISKFHGYFEESGGRWHYVDHESTNGTWLNGRRLGAGRHYPLSGGDRVRFGLELEAVFLPSADLYRRLGGGATA